MPVLADDAARVSRPPANELQLRVAFHAVQLRQPQQLAEAPAEGQVLFVR